MEKDHGRTLTWHNAENQCTTRALALDLTRLKTSNKPGIKGRLKRAGWDNNYPKKF